MFQRLRYQRPVYYWVSDTMAAGEATRRRTILEAVLMVVVVLSSSWGVLGCDVAAPPSSEQGDVAGSSDVVASPIPGDSSGHVYTAGDTVTSDGLEPGGGEDGSGGGGAAHSVPACLVVETKSFDFGLVEVGHTGVLPLILKSCGGVPLELYSVSVTLGEQIQLVTGNVYSLATKPLGVDDLAEITSSSPVVVAPLERLIVPVRYEVVTKSTMYDGGGLVPDMASIHIESNACPPVLDLPVIGYGDPCSCPTAAFTLAESQGITPGTLLHLSGAPSEAGCGASVAEYQWEVEGPQYHTAPPPSMMETMYPVEVSGLYHVSLTVWDDEGRMSCEPARRSVWVWPEEALHLELTWETPGDPDETDGAGSDLDLHLGMTPLVGADGDHDGLPDPWVAPGFDVSGAMPPPDWSPPGPDGDPVLVSEDHDGVGPEHISFWDPADGMYHVAVRVVGDGGFGDSVAKVRIFVHGFPVYTAEDVVLAPGDLWYVARVLWPQELIVPMELPKGGPWIVHGYGLSGPR